MRQARAVEEPRSAAHALDGAVDLARDRELVERCQSGDESAFTELYDRYHRRLFRFCLRRLHEPDDAEEAVQEAFTRAWRALPRFGGERRFYPWLSVIAGNVCTDILRRRSRLVPMDDLPLGAGISDEEEVDAALLRQVDLAMATEALAHLSERHQRVLRLREASGWSTQRIAETEGVAAPAVDTLLWRARQAFKREFVALAEAPGRLAAGIGFSYLALRRFGLRHLARAAARLPLPALSSVRSPGVLAASVAITGAAVAGGTLALTGSGGHPTPELPAAATLAPATASSHGGTGAGAGGAGARTTTAAVGSSAASTAPPGTAADAASAGHMGTTAAGPAGTRSTTGGALPSTGSSLGTAPSVSTALGSAAQGVTNGVGGVVNGVGGAVGGLAGGLGGALSPVGSTVGGLLGGASTTTTTAAPTGTSLPTLGGVVGGVLGGASGAVSSVGSTVGGLLGASGGAG